LEVLSLIFIFLPYEDEGKVFVPSNCKNVLGHIVDFEANFSMSKNVEGFKSSV
jgi:hypothetical protein